MKSKGSREEHHRENIHRKEAPRDERVPVIALFDSAKMTWKEIQHVGFRTGQSISAEEKERLCERQKNLSINMGRYYTRDGIFLFFILVKRDSFGQKRAQLFFHKQNRKFPKFDPTFYARS